MNAIIYNNSSDNNVVHKDLTLIANITVDTIDEFNIETPTFLLDRNDNYLGANYMYVQAFNRYYYINSIDVYNGSMMRINAKSDPLTSFWDSYKGSQCIAYRSTSKPDSRIEDPKVFKKQKPTIIYRKIGTPFTLSTNNNYMLTITGKGTGTA